MKTYIENFSRTDLRTYEKLRKVEKSLNPTTWSAQYQNAPTVIEGPAKYYVWVENK
jgi:hypothetical protein